MTFRIVTTVTLVLAVAAAVVGCGLFGRDSETDERAVHEAVADAEQLAADTALVTLNARESQQQNMFAISGPQFHSGRLKGATFKVISASSTPAK